MKTSSFIFGGRYLKITTKFSSSSCCSSSAHKSHPSCGCPSARVQRNKIPEKKWQGSLEFSFTFIFSLHHENARERDSNAFERDRDQLKTEMKGEMKFQDSRALRDRCEHSFRWKMFRRFFRERENTLRERCSGDDDLPADELLGRIPNHAKLVALYSWELRGCYLDKSKFRVD